MTIELILFVALVALVVYNLGVQAYIHFEAYPLIPLVGKAEFTAYLTDYENRLNIPLLIPYALTVLVNITTIFLRPDELDVVSLIMVLVLNLAIAPISLLVATPVYEGIKKAGTATPQEMGRLMNINWLRLGISGVNALVVLGLLLSLLEK